MRKLMLAMLLAMSVVAMGCRTSMNMRRSLCRGGGDLTATNILDLTSEDKCMLRKVELQKAIVGVKSWIENGTFSSLPWANIQEELAKRLPIKFRPALAQLLSLAGGLDVNLPVPENIKRQLIETCNGIIASCSAYKKEDRL